MSDASAARIEAEHIKIQSRAIDEFQTLYADWMEACAHHQRPIPKEHDEIDFDRIRSERLETATRDLMTTPAILPWMVWDKITVFEHFLYASGEYADWTDRREVWMLGCIKADLMRHRIGRAAE